MSPPAPGELPLGRGTSRVAEGHRALRQGALRVRSTLAIAQLRAPPRGAARELADELGELVSELAHHFEEEEALCRARAHAHDAPTRRWIESWTAEHRSLLGRGRRLAGALADAAGADRLLDGELAGDVRALLDDLVDHELTEARLFQVALFERSP